MELHQVRYFLALCQTLNFTRAAEACNVTQPALTRAIQRLEEELGGPLVYRERALTQLTDLGRAMQPHLEAALQAAQAAKRLATNLRLQPSARLRVGLVPSLSSNLVTASLAQLAGRVPNLEVDVGHDEQADLVGGLLQGDLDAALLIERPALPERLHCWRLFVEGCCIVFPRGHRFERTEAVPWQALDGETVLQAGCWGEAWQEIDASFSAVAARPIVRHRGASWEQLQHMVAAGLGVALQAQHVPLLPDLRSRPMAEAPQRAVVLAVVSGRLRSVALDGFVKLIRARRFAPLPSQSMTDSTAAAGEGENRVA